MRIQFNTGRHYTEQGQRIIAEKVTYNSIIFNDIDRGISGFFPWYGHIRGGLHLQEIVMFCYDHGNYAWSPDADKLRWNDAE